VKKWWWVYLNKLIIIICNDGGRILRWLFQQLGNIRRGDEGRDIHLSRRTAITRKFFNFERDWSTALKTGKDIFAWTWHINRVILQQLSWAPKIFLPKPIQLSFSDGGLESSLVAAIKTSSDICYLGARFSSTYSSWRALGVPFPYGYLNHQRLCLTDRPFLGNRSRNLREGLLFDSLFECGNLDAVQRVG